MKIESSCGESLIRARVVAQHRDRYVVRDSTEDLDAVLSGRFRHHVASPEELPAVGDWVAITVGDTDRSVGQIRSLLPRRSAFRRKTTGAVSEVQIVAANVDVAIIATALPHDINLRRIERYLTLAWESGALPIVVLTKADLVDDPASAIVEVSAIAPGVEVLALSTLSGAGVGDLIDRLHEGVTVVLIGSSGVGKSTLVNALLGAQHQRTSTVRDNGTGRHTTTHRELLELPSGACLIDTPGMREVQLWSADDGLDSAFGDISEFAAHCRFRDCLHAGEPGCAVRAAVDGGALSADRLASWHGLRRELAYLDRRRDAVAFESSRKHDKAMVRALRDHLRDKYS